MAVMQKPFKQLMLLNGDWVFYADWIKYLVIRKFIYLIPSINIILLNTIFLTASHYAVKFYNRIFCEPDLLSIDFTEVNLER